MIERNLLEDVGFEPGKGWDHEVWVYDGKLWVYFGVQKTNRFLADDQIVGDSISRKDFFAWFTARIEKHAEEKAREDERYERMYEGDE